jgi:hypothetical protein
MLASYKSDSLKNSLGFRLTNLKFSINPKTTNHIQKVYSYQEPQNN